MMEALHQLAAALGVALSYTDAFGRGCQVSPETLQAVCGALGFDARDDSAAAESLERLQSDRRNALAPPVVTLRGHVPLDIPITLSRPRDELRVFWELHRETGETSNGSALWRDLEPVGTSHDTETRRLPIVPELAPGYHDLNIEVADASARAAQVRIIAAHQRAYQPPALENGGRVWALATQLYSLKRDDDWGIGDFGALNELVGMAARSGASAVGLNPPHSLFHDDPEHVSPYSPSSRQFTNPLYIDVPAVEDFSECEAAQQLVHSDSFRQRLAELRGKRHVDYAGVTAVKYEALKLLYQHFCKHHLTDRDDPRGQAFRNFQAGHSEALRRYATFNVLREHFGRDDAAMRYWRNWPEEFRQPDSTAVRAFGADHLERVEYFEYLQWQCELQMDRAGLHALGARLPVGLYGDLAIGIDSGGADAWSNRDVVVDGFSAGAPPDPWAHHGQNWGFPPLDPNALRRTGYRIFADVLRANMRQAGALRIDHVLGLRRMFFVPNGRPAAEGAYVDYPFDDLLAVVILESHRNRCLVVGEDLGTLPPGIQEALQSAALYSYRLLYFERDSEGRFKRPGDYPAEAVAAVSTHDLPTLAGYWSGADIGLREGFGMLPTPDDRRKADDERAGERWGLVNAMRQEGLTVDDPHAVPPRLELHRYVARTASKLAVVQLDDAIEEPDQINVPGTHREYPNWRRRYTHTLAEIFADDRAQALFAVMREERPLPQGAPGPGGGGGAGGAFMRRHAAPIASYRMQLNSAFTFKDAQATLPYLYRLGISHLYVSPFTKARPGSTHGYDVTDHNAINPEVGDENSLAQLSNALASLDMGLILDFVPNHMGIGPGNEWWRDVLEWGTASPSARYFDIDWQAHKSELAGKVLVPFLGDNYGAVLERGELVLKFDAEHGTFNVWYFDTPYPITPAHYGIIIRRALTEVPSPGGDDGDVKLRALADAFARLRVKASGRKRQAELREQGRVLKAELAALARQPDIAKWLDKAAGTFAGTPGEPPSFKLLHQLLERQAYRLSFWRVATNEINYRRFFDVNELIGIRQEEPELFDQTHRLVGRLIDEDKIQGLRIDHVDGLFDPAGYCARLRRFVDEHVARRDGAWPRKKVASTKRCFPIYLEKILAHNETMRTEWPVDGTSGYEFLAQVNRVFLRPEGRETMDTAFRNFGGTTEKFEDILEDSKRYAMETLLASELDVLARELDRLSEQHWLSRDFTQDRLRRAIVATVSQYSVYRSYVTAAGCSDDDRRVIENAINRAKRHWQGPDIEILDFLQSVLTLDLVKDRDSGYNRHEVVHFAMRFQQYSSPVMAKGLEDTAGYRYPRYLTLSEVGSEPNLFEMSAGAFHAANEDRRRSWPRNMLTTATHDTKRGEDVRARLNVLSEMPEWSTTVRKWRRFNRRWRTETDGQRTPSFDDEYMIYQTLLGAWPASDTFGTRTDTEAVAGFTERVKDYIVKALREAKTISSWSNPNEAYEQGCRNFVDVIVDERERNLFMEDFRGWVTRIARIGALNSLSQLVLKSFAPGFSDTYQGDELWDLNLVDPDNRRPVDYRARAAMLEAHHDIDASAADALLKDWRSAEIKLYLLQQALQLRNAAPDLFSEGSYEPLRVNGERSSHVLGFGRRHAEHYVLIAVGRWFVSLTEPAADGGPSANAWQDTAIEMPQIPGGILTDIFTGRTYAIPAGDAPFMLNVGDLFATLPVAVLVVTSRPTVGNRAA